MFKQRAFLHWYTKEGIEEQEFVDARENMRNHEQDYDEIYQACHEAKKKERMM